MGRRTRSGTQATEQEENFPKRKRRVESESQGMRRPMRRANTICSCSSPSSSTFLNAHSTFSWFEKDLWTEVAKFLDGRSLVMLAATSRWFNRALMEDCVWKYICMRDLQVSAPCEVSFKWIDLYAAAFDGSHSYNFYHQEKHIDWMRIGAFSMDSSVALLTERLSFPARIPKDGEAQSFIESAGYCVINNVKKGIWIADLQLVRCPVCDLNTCDGTMQTLDARHIELFLNEEYRNGSWEYEQVGSHDSKRHADGASGAIFDVKHLEDCSTSVVFNLKSWVGKPMDWQPRAVTTLHAVAVNTNLQNNEGLNVKYHAMRAGADGEVVSIRISQQLL